MAMTEREFLTKVLATKGIAQELADHATEGLAKLDARNDKRKNTPTKTQRENEPIARAILEALAGGAMLGVDLATAIGQTVNKTNGVARNLINQGAIISTKVKVKGRGELTSYALVPTEDTENTATEDTATTAEVAAEVAAE